MKQGDLTGELSLERKLGWGGKRSESQLDPGASPQQPLHFLGDRVLSLLEIHFSHLQRENDFVNCPEAWRGLNRSVYVDSWLPVWPSRFMADAKEIGVCRDCPREGWVPWVSLSEGCRGPAAQVSPSVLGTDSSGNASFLRGPWTPHDVPEKNGRGI